MKLKKMTEKVKQIFTKPLKFFKGSSSENDVFEKWSEASGKEKIKIIGRFIKQKKSYVIVCVFAVVVIVVSGVVNLKNGVLTKEEEMVNAEEILTESSSSTSTTYAELNTETTSNGPVACHYNADGKLYGKKGTFSGLWPQLEKVAKASNEQYIKDLMVYVGDNTELEKSKYEEDKFTKINGYGTVHWHQLGHKWPNKYSCAYGGGSTSSSNSLFKNIKKDEKIEAVSEAVTESVGKDGKVIEVMPEIMLSDSAVKVEEATTKVVEKSTEQTTKAKTANKNKSKTEPATELQTANSVIEVSGLAPGKVWAGNSCGVCSLAMAFSTLSGVTVSPPEVALAANLLIGNSAWYQVIIYSKSQAKLAQLAGFPVYMEPWNEAKKSTMDACLDANGVALFVSKGSDWVDFGGRHYIMVRNRVGDKYYTADSGKNPTHGFTYQQLSAGYCQQYVVYIYPKNVAQNSNKINNNKTNATTSIAKLNK